MVTHIHSHTRLSPEGYIFMHMYGCISGIHTTTALIFIVAGTEIET